VIISAHYDHIGVRPGQADPIYNGADDDASGTVAVLQLAKKLSSGKKPRRTVYFVLFGSEELGSLGGDHFQKNPPVDLNKIVAQVEFEMIGRPDPKVNPGTLWMTGFERTDLGPELAKRGAALVGDPHPEQNFFERSDNFPMAKRGVVAQTISSYGLHPQYHQPDDDIAHIDFAHMTHAIESMIKPIEWFVNSDFKPQWKPGMKP
jgi:Zn-dependent M28 family amino/carboxypeptidase